ncbi:hypothetical protein Syun_030613 [Stephania yunnanensis]|uniref:Uncharacterized protein n=1 Tax=Stephania yunnanensis TaxID=152371 RepID=A0AAP0DUA6_9MAGN
MTGGALRWHRCGRSGVQLMLWVRDPVECTDRDNDLVVHIGKEMDMFQLERDFNVSAWAYGPPGIAEYHVPRSWLKSSDNLLVIFEETGGNPLGISVNLHYTRTICGSVSESDYPPLHRWTRQSSIHGRTSVSNTTPEMQLQCDDGHVISDIVFASYGTPLGSCQHFSTGQCHADSSLSVVSNVPFESLENERDEPGMLLILAHDRLSPTTSNVSKNIISFMASDLVEKDYESTGSTSIGYKNHADDNLVFPTTNEDAGVTEAV